MSCGDDSNSQAEDSVKAQDPIFFDSVSAAIVRGDEPGWEKYDSLPNSDIELWKKDENGNNYLIQLRFMIDGNAQKVLITDSLPSYRYDNLYITHLESEQLNNAGREELLIRLGGSYSAFAPPISRGEQEDYFYIIDLDNGSLLWHGRNVSEAYQYCIESDDSICSDYEAGYDYKVHVKNGQVVLDSLRYLGDSVYDKPDHVPGHYQWKNDSFVRISE